VAELTASSDPGAGAEPEADAEGDADADAVDEGDTGAVGDGGREGDAGAEARADARARRRAQWRQPRLWVPAVVAVVALSTGAGLAWAGRDDDDVEVPEALPTTTIDPGGIDVDEPEGWAEIPVPQLGFGLAVPPRWEVTVLDPEVLAGLARSEPAVPGFLDAAHAAAESGSVLYGAGVDAQGRVTDLKVRAAPDAGVTDVDGLVAYAGQLAADAGLEATPAVVEGADRPTVTLPFTRRVTDAEGAEVTVTGTETLVLGPRDVVWSLIVTSEVPEVTGEVGPAIVDTLVFAD
jgi:hypothetical protein